MNPSARFLTTKCVADNNIPNVAYSSLSDVRKIVITLCTDVSFCWLHFMLPVYLDSLVIEIMNQLRNTGKVVTDATITIQNIVLPTYQ